MNCPGQYCGRELLPNGNLSDCGSCPRGFRRNASTYICEPCTDNPLLYDWLYLGFVVLLELVLHWFFIDKVIMIRSFCKRVILLQLTALFEVAASATLAILLSHPMGSFTITSCRVTSLADWYTLLHNPRPNFENKIYCTQEAVYPLYTIVFLFYGLSLLLMLLIRPWICRRVFPRQSKMSIYAAMYFIPILVLIHALIGGLLYYAFPYLVVIMSVISCAAHFSIKMRQDISYLIKTTLTKPRNIMILLGHWCLHAYGIISITLLTEPLFHSLLLLLVPLPALFYILTAKFTDPNHSRF
ncbi:JNK1/MAPK8-associated membrane protein [Aethina tumida]|uniref:JNK1/MAPK8-associated membrane protein n=1 Tax=Aethina tumida TaxID=116153 RepID=UPI00096B5B36|nr:JNK1/MAPK8-associated membrane protein [Aethina tumida]